MLSLFSQNLSQGVGGQLSPLYFSLWISDDFTTGESRAKATTFACPSLLANVDEEGHTFRLDAIEAYATTVVLPQEDSKVSD